MFVLLIFDSVLVSVGANEKKLFRCGNVVALHSPKQRRSAAGVEHIQLSPELQQGLYGKPFSVAGSKVERSSSDDIFLTWIRSLQQKIADHAMLLPFGGQIKNIGLCLSTRLGPAPAINSFLATAFAPSATATGASPGQVPPTLTSASTIAPALSITCTTSSLPPWVAATVKVRSLDSRQFTPPSPPAFRSAVTRSGCHWPRRAPAALETTLGPLLWRCTLQDEI